MTPKIDPKKGLKKDPKMTPKIDPKNENILYHYKIIKIKIKKWKKSKNKKNNYFKKMNKIGGTQNLTK